MRNYRSFCHLLPGIVTVLIFTLQGCKETDETELPEIPGAVYESEYSFSLNKEKTIPVSDKLMGFNLIYPHEKNSIWQDGKIAGYLKDVNVGFLRYPGGTVCSYYHWNALTGEGWKDSWDPDNPVTPKAPSGFMDVDEYIELVRSTGATPLVGINVSSGWRWNRQQEGLEEAIALMQYCKDKNFEVKYWYLDNEPYQHDSNGGSKTPEQYADLINTYVPVMKAFDPNIKTIVNWNAGYRNKRAEHERLIKRAGNNIDIVDVHWYWSWSDTSWEKWLGKTPMVEWTGYNYMEDIRYFKQMVEDFGFPDIEMASLEWNTGPISIGNSLTASRAAFAQSEMMMQFIAGGLDYAVFWPIHWPDQSSKPRSFVDTSDNSANPNYQLFKFLGQMQGGSSIETTVSKNKEDVLILAVQDKNQNTLRICVLNKNTENLVTDIELNQFPGMKFKEGQRYVASPDGSFYSLDNFQLLESEKPEIAKFLAKSISLTMLTFEQQ
jgi:hypothetical protein